MRRLACACAALLLCVHGAEAITIANGELNVIDDGAYNNQNVEVRDGPGATPTTVRIVAGGRVGAFLGHRKKC